jgi:GTP-binding protein Era
MSAHSSHGDDASGAHRAGTVAIVGRSNVGKSTLLNAVMGTKLAIVSPRPQTTRNRIAGIKTLPAAQLVFLDTPGMHDPAGSLGHRMVRIAHRALGEADVALLVIDSRAGIQRGDEEVVAAMRTVNAPVVVALNKMDLVRRSRLLPLMEAMGHAIPTAEIVPVSASAGTNVDVLLGVLGRALPVGPPRYPADEITDQTVRFMVQELIREKVFQYTRDEIPYGSAVITDEMQEPPPRPGTPAVAHVRATVLVARDSHKPIVIGKDGQRLKEIGREARLDIEKYLGTRVFLELFVKVDRAWDTNPSVLRDVGL